jgi:4-amino-4-deoxy-L-arabinose transferase-like glycosyltransferase
MKKALLTILTLNFILIFLLSISTNSLSSDMIENLIWGRMLDFSSDKHPPFFAWESYLTVKIFGGNLLFYHILTPLHQVFLLLFVFLLAEKILQSKEKALLAVVFAGGIIVHAFYYKFNANTANYGFFGAIYFLFYLSVKEEKIWLFIPLGVLCGIVMLIKYSAIILIGCLWLTLFVTKEGRKALKSPFVYIGILAFFAVITPYILSILDAKNYQAFSYLSQQSTNAKFRWFEIPRFLITPIIFCIPFLIAFFNIRVKFKKTYNFDAIFLAINAFLPFLVTLLYIIFTGSQVGVFWLSMFFSLFPICAVYFFELKPNALITSAKIVYPVMLFIYVFYLIPALINAEDNTKEIGKFVNEINTPKTDYFICNDNRRICGTVLLYGTIYDKTKMTVSLWKNPFEEVNKMVEKPSKIIIIGMQNEINLEGYRLETKELISYKYFKFKFLEKFYNNPPKILKNEVEKLKKPIKITLTTATLLTDNAHKQNKFK